MTPTCLDFSLWLFFCFVFFWSGSRWWKMSDMTASWSHSSAALTPSTMTLPVQPTPIPLSGGKGLFVYLQFPLPCPFSIVPRADFHFSWMSFKDGAALGGRRGLDFQLSALGFESIGSDNVHPEQTIDLLLNKTTSCHEKKEVNTGEEAVNKDSKKGSRQIHAALWDPGLHFYEIWFLCFVSLTLNKQIFQI